ncbi:helicase associated domain-containing protein [Streptomyces microflavus]|uniref:helicase associated domain-containing protein n=1 Tax=Streptomyces microflavus TaxID=1919 RepID=UPI0038039174
MLPAIQPGVLFERDNLGKRLQRQTNFWAQLSAEQQERLSVLGVKPAQRVAAAAGGPGAPGRRQQPSSGAWAALTQTSALEGHQRVPGTHAEAIAVEGETTRVVVKLGVWISNTKSRRVKLTADQRGALTELGVEGA